MTSCKWPGNYKIILIQGTRTWSECTFSLCELCVLTFLHGFYCRFSHIVANFSELPPTHTAQTTTYINTAVEDDDKSSSSSSESSSGSSSDTDDSVDQRKQQLLLLESQVNK